MASLWPWKNRGEPEPTALDRQNLNAAEAFKDAQLEAGEIPLGAGGLPASVVSGSALGTTSVQLTQMATQGKVQGIFMLYPEVFAEELEVKEGEDYSTVFVAITEYIRREAAAAKYSHFGIRLQPGYTLNGNPVATLGGNSIWPFPTYGDTACVIELFCAPGGTTFTTTRTTDVDSAEHGPPSIIGGPTNEQMGFTTGHFSSATVYIHGKLTTVAPNNPKIAGQNWSRIPSLSADLLNDRTVSATSTQPTHPWAFGIYLPEGDNSGQNVGREVQSQGRYVGIVMNSAHTNFQGHGVNYCYIGYGLTGNRQFSGNDGHSSQGVYMWPQECTIGIAGWSPREQEIENLAGVKKLMTAGLNSIPEGCPFKFLGVVSLDIEDGKVGSWYSPEWHVYDAYSQIYAKGRYGRVEAGVGPLSGPLKILGGRNFNLTDGTVSEPGSTFTRIAVLGHSFMQGTGASNYSRSMGAQGAKLLGADIEAFAVAGVTTPCAEASPYSQTFNQAMAATYLLNTNKELPFSAVVEAALVMSGINDLNVASVIEEPEVLIGALRFIIHTLRARARVATTDASWAFATGTGGSAWSAATGSQFTGFPGEQLERANAVGNTFTITLPSWWPEGGTFELWAAATKEVGGVWAMERNGTGIGNWETNKAANSELMYPLFTVANCKAGDTIKGTLTSAQSSGKAWLMCYTTPSASLPAIGIYGIPRAPAYPTGAHTITDANTEAFSTKIRELCESFTDGHVAYINSDAILEKKAAYFNSTLSPASVHPNDLGHSLLGQGGADALRAISLSETAMAGTWGFAPDVQGRRQVPEYSTAAVGSNLAQSVVLTLVAGTATWTNPGITNSTRINTCFPIGDPTAAKAGTVGITEIKPTASSSEPGKIVVKSTNAEDVRKVHLSVFEAV